MATFSAQEWLHLLADIAAAVILISTLVIFASEIDASDALAGAREAMDEAMAQKTASEEQERKFVEIEKTYKNEIDRLSHLQAARDLVRALLEDVLVNHNADEQSILTDILQQARRPLFLAHGFKMDEHYTICAYERVMNVTTGKAELHIRAHIRAIDCDLKTARVWVEGIGAAGSALARQGEIIVKDMANSELYTALERRPDDEVKFASIVAEPIWADDGPHPWGVLVATSSVPGHFSRDDRTYVQATECLATMMSLALKIVRSKPTSKLLVPKN
jgi:hypothetical protein